MPESSKKTLQETLASLRKIVLGMNFRNALKVEREQEKDRAHKLQKYYDSDSNAPHDLTISHRLSILEIDGWHLLSGEKHNQLRPKTFKIPSQYKRYRLQPGAIVKLMFEFAVEENRYSGKVVTERMWVSITKVEKPYYIGKLDNNPASSSLLSLGDEVLFLPEHIINIWQPKH